MRVQKAKRMLACGVLLILSVAPAACAQPVPQPSVSVPSVPSVPSVLSARPDGGKYPWHTDIVATTFWVGEIFDPEAEDGSQETSTYDSEWLQHHGCDGVLVGKICLAEARQAANGYAPRGVTPRENPFYLDLPYDDINNAAAFRERAAVIPWANEPGYAGRETDSSFSYMKNRWVRIVKGDRECYGQIEDAGPGQYQDKAYVFGATDARPANKNFNGAGLDVSPSLNGCLGFAEINGENDRVNWQFVDDEDVPPGPWKNVITTRQVH